MTTLYTSFEEVQPRLEAFCKKMAAVEGSAKVGLMGYDGFVDSFIRFVNPASMAEFGPKITAAAGIATSAEVRRQGQKYGGNGPLMTAALSKLFVGNIALDYLGAIGYPEVDPLFKEAFAGAVGLYPFDNPATTDCFEFSDGKLLGSDMSNCATVSWDNMLKIVGEDKLRELVAAADFSAGLNWSRLIHATELWQNMAALFAELHGDDKKIFYMDLAELDIRSQEDRDLIPPMFEQISNCCHTIVSLNLKEAWQVAAMYGGDFTDERAPAQVAACAAYIRENSALDEVIIHPNDGAAISRAEETVYVCGPFCSDPLISTGAGDHFGAGAMAARVLELDGFESMLLGCATSGYFVRTGISPSFAQIVEMLELWGQGRLGDRL